jgi:hypothetical protein
LEVHFDIAAWLRQLGTPIKIEGTTYPTVLDEIAARSRPPYAIEPGTPEHAAILLGIKNVSPPGFSWISISQ